MILEEAQEIARDVLANKTRSHVQAARELSLFVNGLTVAMSRGEGQRTFNVTILPTAAAEPPFDAPLPEPTRIVAVAGVPVQTSPQDVPSLVVIVCQHMTVRRSSGPMGLSETCNGCGASRHDTACDEAGGDGWTEWRHA